MVVTDDLRQFSYVTPTLDNLKYQHETGMMKQHLQE